MNAASMPDEEFIAKAGPDLAPRLFVNKNVWQRIAVVAAGPIANIIFTFLILYALLLGYGRYTLAAGDRRGDGRQRRRAGRAARPATASSPSTATKCGASRTFNGLSRPRPSGR